MGDPASTGAGTGPSPTPGAAAAGAAAPPAAFEPRAVPAACPVCGADEPSPYRAGMYRIGAMPFHLVRCPCGMVYVNPRPDGGTLARMYDDPAYYTEGYNLGVETENYFERKDELLALYDASVAEIERETGVRSGDLLELGSAGGFFLEAARRRSWRVRGIEISPPAVEYSRRELALEVFAGDLADAPFPARSFDVAVADNVLEHTTDPAAVLAHLRRLLRPGGHLVVIVPSYVNSPYFRALLLARRFVPRRLLGPQLLRLLKLDPESDERGGGHPYHILEFDRRTLTALLRRAGFEIRSIERSLPLPAHLFKVADPPPRVRFLRTIFLSMDALMRRGLLPGARLRVLARAP